MEDSRFWDLVESVTKRVPDIEEVFDRLVEAVSKLTPNEIIAFKQKQCELNDLTYRWDIWAVAYILNGGCSDDGFTYFRSGLILGGREKFEATLTNPESLADWLPEDFEAEDFMYIANDAYEKVTGEEFPYDRLNYEGQDDPLGEAWDEDDLPKLYPDLCNKYF
ncbi:DUF4240 domain-containing protein [Microbulbifer sp. TRSA005]|uniref:DUF4240 domain-containing protein n=1 Tax=Microbulbifer sp. TRSA005 TaxID=3243383 RepID=UPI0040397529